MQPRQPHNAAFSNLAFTDFKLRFNQREDGCIGVQELNDDRDNDFKRNKGNINGNQIIISIYNYAP